MTSLFKTVAPSLLAIPWVSCQTAATSPFDNKVVAVPDLGFRYTPPPGMMNKTSASSQEARSHAASYTGKRFDLLLDLSSDEDDTFAAWHQVWIFNLPRATWPAATWPALSDAAATAKMNSLAAGAKATAIGPPQSTVISGRNFVASEFELNEPPLVKHAKIFATNCKGQLVAFVFVSNSAAKISAMEESLKTLDFSKR
jgi:hypothetical protein